MSHWTIWVVLLVLFVEGLGRSSGAGRLFLLTSGAGRGFGMFVGLVGRGR